MLTDAPLPIRIKRNALKRCLVNLIDNALKYGTRVEIAAARDGRMAEIAIDDDGPGIAPAERARVFDRFHRVQGAKARTQEGTGIGLVVEGGPAARHAEIAIGVFQHGLDLATAARTYTILTVGEGLVTSIPALLVSMSGGLITTRSSSGNPLGDDVLGQIV